MMEIRYTTSLNMATIKVACSKDYMFLRLIYLPTLENKVVRVIELYRNPDFSLKNSKEFEKFFIEQFPEVEATEVIYTPDALNVVTGLAELNTQKS